MFKVIMIKLMTLYLFFLVASTLQAAETQTSSVLTILNTAPASGKAREAGFDNNYNMKQTTTEASLIEKCVLASRGIIMLDRASWAKCGVDSQ